MERFPAANESGLVESESGAPDPRWAPRRFATGEKRSRAP